MMQWRLLIALFHTLRLCVPHTSETVNIEEDLRQSTPSQSLKRTEAAETRPIKVSDRGSSSNCTDGSFYKNGECVSCDCYLPQTPENMPICNHVTGACNCKNWINMCKRFSLFTLEFSSHNMLYVLILFALMGASLLVNWYIQVYKKDDAHTNLDPNVVMLQLQEQLTALLKSQGQTSEDDEDEGKDKLLYFDKQSNLISKTGFGSKLHSYGRLQQQTMKTRSNASDLDEVTTAILNAAKGKIHEARRSQEISRINASQSIASRGVEGEYYIDRVTGKKVKDISMDADEEGEILSVIFPRPDEPVSSNIIGTYSLDAEESVASRPLTLSPDEPAAEEAEEKTSIHVDDKSIITSTTLTDRSPKNDKINSRKSKNKKMYRKTTILI